MLSDEEQPLPPDYREILKKYARVVHRLAGSTFIGACQGSRVFNVDDLKALEVVLQEVQSEYY